MGSEWRQSESSLVTDPLYNLAVMSSRLKVSKPLEEEMTDSDRLLGRLKIR